MLTRGARSGWDPLHLPPMDPEDKEDVASIRLPNAQAPNEFAESTTLRCCATRVQGMSARTCEFQSGREAFIKMKDPTEPRRPQAKERKWWKQLRNLSRNGCWREGRNCSFDHIRYLLQIVMQDSNCLLGGQEANCAGLASNRVSTAKHPHK